ncbi:MAG: RT0821/Lpp0805 family surface protein [Alphaproteobacteria bacterium]
MKKTLLALAAISMVTVGCTGGPKETGGTLLGGAAGALIGSQIGGGTGKLVAVAAGTLLGAWAGGAVGRKLDEEDRQAMQQATLQSIQNNQSTSWSSSHNQGVSGTITPTKSYNSANGYCRNYQQTVKIDGKSQKAHGTACRGEDGQWRIIK